ncbi:hypothetical protein ABZ372_06185 [Streptomyces sp. NPDC005921]
MVTARGARSPRPFGAVPPIVLAGAGALAAGTVCGLVLQVTGVADTSTLVDSRSYVFGAGLLLAVGLYGSTYGIDLKALRADLRGVVAAVTLGVVLKAALITGTMLLVFHRPEALVLGVAVAQIDPLSVAALGRNDRMSPRARSLLPAFWVGQPVGVRIDLVARTAHAALHTAGHLIEAAGREQGWVPAANSHFPGQARIGFTAPVPDARLDTPEGREEVTEALRAAVARAVVWDLPVTWGNDSEGRRIVRLSGLHSALCGGTHVRSLGDLAGVVLRDLKVRKGRIRVSCSAAHRERS